MVNSGQEIKSSAIERNVLLNERYLILDKIAVGGMGNVYRGLDLEQNSLPIAIKVLHKGLLTEQQYSERFIKEVSLCETVNHPNVVKVFDLHKSKDLAFFTMELIEGISLEEKLENGTFPIEQIPRLIIEICDGLRAIHQAEIIHRDLKPGNIMLQTDGSIKIIDFGVSRDQNSKLTTKNVKVGSVLYIAPEIWKGHKASKQSDFYSLGIMLYEICMGKTPFIADNVLDLMKLHVEQKIPDLDQKFPLWLNRLIKLLTNKQVEDRPNDTDEIIKYIHQNNPESQAIQTFDRLMVNTVRSGQGMISVFDSLVINPQKKCEASKRKALVFSLRATRPAFEENKTSTFKKTRSKTILLKLPNKSALVFEFELPSKDFIFLGVFLASLNVFDGYLTRQGMNAFGLHSEGNDFLRVMMQTYGVDLTLACAKGFAIFAVLLLTIMARKSKFIKDLVGTLSVIYLFAAVIPWIYILYYR